MHDFTFRTMGHANERKKKEKKILISNYKIDVKTTLDEMCQRVRAPW